MATKVSEGEYTMQVLSMESMDLLKKVRGLIADNPEHHNQTNWVVFENGRNLRFSDNAWENVPLSDIVSPYTCGTTMCVAGWLAFEGNMSMEQVILTYPGIDALFQNQFLHTDEVLFYLDYFIEHGEVYIPMSTDDEEPDEDEEGE